MADSESGSADLTEWVPNPRALEIGRGLWDRFCIEFQREYQSSYYIDRRGCYELARHAGPEKALAVKQWKAWELYLATAKIEGRI